MKQFQIFRAGKHIASNGTELTFSEEDLRAAVAAYDPELHEAPITVGHPKDNAPAYGWVRKLDFSDGVISAEADQIEAQFEEMVQAGRFKKRSASFYTPDSPANPKPGTYYLRHVAFLGAQPPAVKGLKDVNFAEEEGVLEFADSRYLASIMARFARSLREWVIADKGIETADKVTPDYLVADLEAEARRADDESLAGPNPAFSEDETMDKEKLQEQVTKLTADLAAANERAAKAGLPETSVEVQAAASYSAWQILEAGVRGANSLDDKAIAAWLKANQVDSIHGRLRFNGPGNYGDDLMRVKQVQDGKWVTVWPKEWAAPGVRLR